MTYLLQRLFYVLLTVLGVLTISFLLLRSAPGDPISMILMSDDRLGLSQDVVQEMRRRLGLDLPVAEQYVRYLALLVRGDFGRTIHGNQPVLAEIAKNFPPTAALALSGILFALVVGISAGMLSALHRDTWVDYTVTAAALFMYSAPNFWFGILLLYLLAYQLGWFPIVDSRGGDLMSQIHVLILPAIIIGSHSAAVIARMTRSALLEVLGLDYVRTASAKGVARRLVVLKHALRNAAIPVVTVGGLSFASLLGGSVVVEIVFARRGLGRLVFDAVYGRDYTLVQGTIVILALIAIVVNILLDVAFVLLDPRIRYG